MDRIKYDTNVPKTTGSSFESDYIHPHGCGKPGCEVCLGKEDFPLVNPHCQHCGGAGFVHPMDEYDRLVYGKAVTCREPGCYFDNWTNKERDTLNVNQTFDTFDTKRHRELPEPYDSAKNFANETGLRLFLHFGDRGCGKTHLLNAIWNYRRRIGKPVTRYSMNELFNKLADAMGNNTVEQKFAEAASAPMLLLDDLDIVNLTDWKLERFKELLDYRTQNSLWTHITTHNSLEQIKYKSPDLDDRFSDLSKCLCIFNEAPSYRKEQRKTRKVVNDG